VGKKIMTQMPMPSVIQEHIEITPGVCGGKARIAGHRIKVQDIAIWLDENVSNAIAESLLSISPVVLSPNN
jgi:uncharacterized protein (DUF433 family)